MTVRGGRHHLRHRRRPDRDHDAGLPGRGVQRLVQAVVVAHLLLGHAPGGQQHLVQHRGVDRAGPPGARRWPRRGRRRPRTRPGPGPRPRRARRRTRSRGRGGGERVAAVGRDVLQVGHGQRADRAVDRPDRGGGGRPGRRAAPARGPTATSPAGPPGRGARPGAGGRRRSGGARRRSAPGSGPAPRRSAVSWSSSVIAQSRCRLPSRAVKSAAGSPVAALPIRSRSRSEPSWTSRIGSRLVCVVRISTVRSSTGPGITSSCGRTTRSLSWRSPTRPMRPADGRAVDDVLVDVERRLVVGAQERLLPPLPQPVAHRQVGPLEAP